jgi:hypothetical protein
MNIEEKLDFIGRLEGIVAELKAEVEAEQTVNI